MKDILVRSASGLVYVCLILSTMYIDREWGLLLFAILGGITLYELLNLIQLKALVPLLLLFISFVFLYKPEYPIFASIIFTAGPILLIASCIFNSVIAYQLIKSIQPKYNLLYRYGLSFLYLIAGIVFMTSIAYGTPNSSPKLLVAVFSLIWANDSFAYLVGVNFGKRKLFPSVSPKKSVEGFIGGLVGAVLISIAIAYLYPSIAMLHWVFIAILAGSLGTIGDLIQSKLKRIAGVKDSGKIMPGHGGMYDRLDSVLYTSPFIYAYLFYVI